MTFQSGLVDSGTTAFTVASHTTANTKGSWQELIGAASSGSALGFDAKMIHIISTYTLGTSNSPCVIDIGVDAAGGTSYSVVIPDLWMPNIGTLAAVNWFSIPKSFPSGCSIAVRVQTANANNSIGVQVILSDEGGLPTINTITALNVNTSSATDATAIDPGGSANTEGSWTELIASTAANYDGFILVMNIENGAPSVASWLLDIGIDTGGGDTAILQNIGLSVSNATPDSIYPNCPQVFHYPIASGTQILARCQCTITDATDRLINDVAIYGFVNNNDLPAGGSGGVMPIGGGFVVT